MSKAWSMGSTTAWRKLRAVILAKNVVENRGLCNLGLEGCAGQADQVHHTHGRQVTGDDPRYLQAVCRSCNNKVGDPAKNPDPPHRPKTIW